MRGFWKKLTSIKLSIILISAIVAGSLLATLIPQGRAEGSVRLSADESVELPGGEVLRLVRFTDSRYEDGRPKDWTSVVSI